MHLLSILLVVTCVANIGNAEEQSNENLESEENGNEDTKKTDKNLVDHTFVALIDIVFTDNSKRSCTGSIIHDNVVVTAAHCFTTHIHPSIMPELTASFVVIGSKKMFDTGYEQYLPIERVLTHPKFNGWTADLSLVFTFAGMTSDKPGTIIPLAGVKTSTHVDSNVTVLSWGHMKDVYSNNDWVSKREKCSGSESQEEYTKEDLQNDNNKAKVTAILQSKIRHRSNYGMTSIPLTDKKVRTFRKQRYTFRAQSRGQKTTQEKNKFLASLKSRSQKTKVISRYLSGEERITRKPSHYHKHRTTLGTAQNNEPQDKEQLMIYDEEAESSHKMHNHSVMIPQTELNSFKSYYKNWRRQMGSQQNKLTVEVFGFVNVQACKKLVEKAMPAKYDISDGNDVVCYATEDHFISDEDSGAPAVRHGKLVAVTVGGAEIDGDHVAVGMKMSCYCTWITDNLPSGSDKFDCCKSCCDVTHKEEIINKSYKRLNKYL